MLNVLFGGLVLVLGGFQSNDAVSQRPLTTMAQADLAKLYGHTYQAEMPLPTGARVLKLNYSSPNSPSGYQRLSGALYLPTDVAPRGLVVFYHGTTISRNEVPSRLVESATLDALPFLAQGFAVALPDYIGQGDSPGRHPYPLGRINAWSGIDMVAPARKVAADLGLPVGDALFVSGYSEGGAVAMWGARHAQENPRLGIRWRAAAPLSGPYDLSGVTAQSMIQAQSNPIWRAVRVMLVAYIGYSAEQWVPGSKLSDFFVPAFASYVPLVFKEAKDDDAATKRLVIKALEINPLAVSIKPILQPKFAKALESGDQKLPLMQTMTQNNCYDWAPQMPMRMVALERDFVVVVENTKKALAAMRARGVPASRVDAVILPDDLNHITAAPKCGLIAAEYFASQLP